MGNGSVDEVERELVRHYDALRRFAAVVADSDLDPDDITQEAMTKVLVATRRGRGPTDDVAAYVRRAIVSVCSNSRRSLARRTIALTRVGRVDDSHTSTYPSEFDLLDRVSAQSRWNTRSWPCGWCTTSPMTARQVWFRRRAHRCSTPLATSTPMASRSSTTTARTLVPLVPCPEEVLL